MRSPVGWRPTSEKLSFLMLRPATVVSVTTDIYFDPRHRISAFSQDPLMQRFPVAVTVQESWTVYRDRCISSRHSCFPLILDLLIIVAYSYDFVGLFIRKETENIQTHTKNQAKEFWVWTLVNVLIQTLVKTIPCRNKEQWMWREVGTVWPTWLWRAILHILKEWSCVHLHRDTNKLMCLTKPSTFHFLLCVLLCFTHSW